MKLFFSKTPATNHKAKFISIIKFFNSPFKVFFISISFYLILGLLGNKSIWIPSDSPYFNYLADAFLHGQFHFRLDPPITHDLVIFDNKIFAYWPPFPALLMMPFVAILGVNFPDILFTIFLGSFNVSLLTILFSELRKKGIIYLDPIKQGLLGTIFFAFGTVYLTMVSLGKAMVYCIGCRSILRNINLSVCCKIQRDFELFLNWDQQFLQL